MPLCHRHSRAAASGRGCRARTVVVADSALDAVGGVGLLVLLGCPRRWKSGPDGGHRGPPCESERDRVGTGGGGAIVCCSIRKRTSAIFFCSWVLRLRALVHSSFSVGAIVRTWWPRRGQAI